MRKTMVILLAGLLWLNLGFALSPLSLGTVPYGTVRCQRTRGLSSGGSLALADGMILPATLNADYLTVRYHRVTVHINDGHAVTQVEQAFYNPHPFQVVGRYLFPVPPEAMLSRFQAVVDGQPQSVERQDPATTNAALYPIIAERRDPSLLQYADWETLAFDLTLPPGGSRHMALEYEEVLAPSGGLYRYRYVLSTERYSSQPLEEAALMVHLHSSSGLASLYSSTHPVTTERLGPGQARVRWEAQNVLPTEDFELFFAPAERGFGGGLLTGQRNDDGHFLFIFSPETELNPTESLPKDIVFIMDRSGSMNGEKMEQARDALHFILGQLNGDDRFSIVSFNDRLSVLAETLQPVERSALADAHRYVDRLYADGNTDLEAALQTGLEVLSRSELRRGASRIVVFLTDGLPTAGVTDAPSIARLVTESNARLEARLHVFGVGYDVNTHLLDRLAADNGGSVTYVQPGENLEAVLTEFYAHIAHPVLTDVTVAFEGWEANDLYPQTMPDLFQGSSLLLTGRYRAADATVAVRVRGRAGDERREYVYHFDLEQVTEGDFVPRLWATRRIGQLLDRVRVEGESETLVEEIRSLGLSYGLVTPYTTFVIAGQTDGPASVDNMDLYQRGDLNSAWGETTVQARVQNQAYQLADQANLASGANVVNNGQRSLAGVGHQNIDLSLLQNQTNLDGPITEEWIAHNIGIDRTVAFGSEEYFHLASDADARSFLQSGVNVVFSYQGQVVSVQDGEYGSEKIGETDEDAESPSRLPDSTGGGTGRRQDRAESVEARKGAPRLCLAPYAIILPLSVTAVALNRRSRLGS